MSNNAYAGISFGLDSQKVFKYRDENMCSKWNIVEKNIGSCKVKIYGSSDGNIIVTGNVNQMLKSINMRHPMFVQYIAANKPTYSQSYAGSGMPYPNKEMAFQNTSNKGIVPLKGGAFTFNIEYPNSYYIHMGKTLVPPQVKICFCDINKVPISDIHIVQVGNGIPYRSLTWPQKRNWNKGSLFYCNNNLPVRDQQTIIKNSAYPCVNKESPNFWGLVPPH